MNTTKGRRIYFPNSRWYSKIVRTRSRILGTHSKAEQKTSGAKTSVESFKANGKVFNRQKQTQHEIQNLQASGNRCEVLSQMLSKMLLKPWTISGRCKVTSIYRHHIEPRVQLNVLKEETFPIPLKFIDDYWNVNVNQSLSDSCTGLTTFTLKKEKLRKVYSWSVERLKRGSRKRGTRKWKESPLCYIDGHPTLWEAQRQPGRISKKDKVVFHGESGNRSETRSIIQKSNVKCAN